MQQLNKNLYLQKIDWVGCGWGGKMGGTLRYLESKDGECCPLSLLSNVFIFRNKDDVRI